MNSIPESEYSNRRNKLIKRMYSNSVAILSAAPQTLKNRGVKNIYRQESNFQYLSGFPEPEAIIILFSGNNIKKDSFIILCQERCTQDELWNPSRIGLDGAVRHFGADLSYPIEERFEEIVTQLVKTSDFVYLLSENFSRRDFILKKMVNALHTERRIEYKEELNNHQKILPLDNLLSEMRLYKSPAEISIMRRAASISSRAHIRAMIATRPNLNECDLEAEIDHEFRSKLIKSSAYKSIIASGTNACTLHYDLNNAVLNDGDLVLIDAGCELDCYASDITRTFPINGKFSKEQKKIYELVLAAQQAAIAVVLPGNSWLNAHHAAVQVITSGLLDLKILEGNLSDLIAQKAYNRFYMHRIGHWLGLDVHDVGNYKNGLQEKEFEVGMTLTIEPGIYIRGDDITVQRKWRGIGVRIEDNLVITSDGNEVITEEIPRLIEDIEGIMASNRIK